MKVWIILFNLLAGMFTIFAGGSELAVPKTEPQEHSVKPEIEDIQKSENARKGVADVFAGSPVKAGLNEKTASDSENSLRKQLLEQREFYERTISDMELAYDAELTELKEENNQLKQELRKTRELAQEIAVFSISTEERDLKEENSVLRKELLETLERCSASMERLKALEMSAASLMDTMGFSTGGSREADFIREYEKTLNESRKLAEKCRNAANLLETAEQEELRNAGIDLGQEAGEYLKKYGPPQKTWKVLEVNSKAGVVLLSCGYLDGVRNNMTVHPVTERISPLRIISVRNRISAAIPEDGSLEKWKAGMEVSKVKADADKN